MEDRILEKKEGWQMIVEIFNNKIIKYPKNRKQIERVIIPYLKSISKENELEERTSKMINDVNSSIKILKKSGVPMDHFANLKFLKNGKIWQDKVLILDDIFNKDKDKTKKIIDEYISFVIFLWSYGIHENTYKMHSNFGLIDGKLVLIDPFEITDNKEKVLSQIQRKKWAKHSKYGKNLSKEMIDYLINQANNTWTERKLNEIWKENLK